MWVFKNMNIIFIVVMFMWVFFALGALSVFEEEKISYHLEFSTDHFALCTQLLVLSTNRQTDKQTLQQILAKIKTELAVKYTVSQFGCKDPNT